MALQHWKIFTPGMFVTCKTNKCTLEGNFSALLWSKEKKKILRTSWRICVLYKHQELTNSSPAFFFSPLISSHLPFSWPSSLWSTFKIILNWLHHFPRLCKCISAEQQRGTKELRFFGRKTKQQAWFIPSFGQRSGTHLDSYLPIVLEASINIGVRDLTQEDNLSAVRKCICL